MAHIKSWIWVHRNCCMTRTSFLSLDLSRLSFIFIHFYILHKLKLLSFPNHRNMIPYLQNTCNEFWIELNKKKNGASHTHIKVCTCTRLLFLSHQTAGCLRSRNQCLFDSLDWGPLLPRDSSVMIGPAKTDVHRHVGIQKDTDSNYTNKQLQDKSMQWHRGYCWHR